MTALILRENIEFKVQGDTVRGTIFKPEQPTTEMPGVVLSHGWGMVMEGDLTDYALAIARQGICCLAIDFRCLGYSDGFPRQHLDPWKQIEDIRSAVDFLIAYPNINKDRIGVWGSSYSGGHVLSISAIDMRIKAAVAQVPTISGHQAGITRLGEAKFIEHNKLLLEARAKRIDGFDTETIVTVSDTTALPCAYPDAASYNYMTAQGKRCPSWKNYTSKASIELARAYEPAAYIYRIEDVSILMIVAIDDTTTPTKLQTDAFDRIPTKDKELLMIPGGHYAVYQEQFAATSEAAALWFKNKL